MEAELCPAHWPIAVGLHAACCRHQFDCVAAAVGELPDLVRVDFVHQSAGVKVMDQIPHFFRQLWIHCPADGKSVLLSEFLPPDLIKWPLLWPEITRVPQDHVHLVFLQKHDSLSSPDLVLDFFVELRDFEYDHEFGKFPVDLDCGIRGESEEPDVVVGLVHVDFEGMSCNVLKVINLDPFVIGNSEDGEIRGDQDIGDYENAKEHCGQKEGLGIGSVIEREN